MSKLKRLWWMFFGKWKVKYPDGKVSIGMNYYTAKGYAEAYNGKVFPTYEGY